MRRRWSEQEIETLRAMYADTNTELLAARLGRTARSVFKAAEARGLKKSSEYLTKACRFRLGDNFVISHPIGHERITQDGYLQRKVSATGQPREDYRPVHHIVWMDAGRDIPPGHYLAFRDGDKRNFALENLELVTAAERMRRNSFHNYPKSIAQAIQLRGVLNRKINRLGDEVKT